MLSVLRSAKIFSDASEEALAALEALAQARNYPAEAQIFAEGEPGDGIYVIESGRVLISSLISAQDRRTLSRFGPGDFFGEMAVVDNEPRSATATAEVDTVVAFLPREALLGLLERFPKLALNLVQEFSRRQRAFNRQYIRETLEAERLALVGRFARSVVHDFKNPLNVISLAAEFLAAERATPEMRRTAKTRVLKQIQRLSNMINELLDFTRGTQHASVLAATPYAQLIQQWVEDVRAELSEKRVSVELENPPPDAPVLVDPDRWTRVLFNLANNAVEAMPEGGQIRLRFRCELKEIWTEVEDSGPGIDPEIAPRLFEPFATFGKAHGTGLGLSICRRIIEDHGGRIQARTESGGRGAIFAFSIPRAAQGTL